MSLTLKCGLCKYSLICGLEGSVSNRKAWVKIGTAQNQNRIKFGINGSMQVLKELPKVR